MSETSTQLALTVVSTSESSELLNMHQLGTIRGKHRPPEFKDGLNRRDNIRQEEIPAELRELEQWVCWRYEVRRGKPTKVPINAIRGAEADCTDRGQFATFQQALAAFRRDQNLSGIGFVFSDDDPFCGIDVDHCIEQGVLSEQAQSILQRFPGTYAEVSPSGTGIKLWLRGSLPIPPERTGRKSRKLGIETYCRGRYFTVTGQRLYSPPSGRNHSDSPTVLDHGMELQRWFVETFRTVRVNNKPKKAPATAVSATVSQIVEKASASRNGDRFRRLWAGDLSGHGNDHSSGDLALCSMLAFWCNGNEELIDECFRASGLMRDKWEREDYRHATIQKAVDSCSKFYSWDRSPRSGVSPVLSLDSVMSHSAHESEPWPELIPISGPEPAEMSIDDFPPVVGEIVQAVVNTLEVPVELPGMMALGVLATAAQKKFIIRCDGSYSEPMNLYLCPAMPPGERKTAVVGILMAPLRQWEKEQRTKLSSEIREKESLRRTAEKRIEYLRVRASKCEDASERCNLQREIDAVEREMPTVRCLPLLITDDCTPEHCATLLSRHGERLAVVSDEGGIFDIIAGRYSRGSPNLDVYLQSHSGSAVRVHRGSREPVDLQSPCLTVAVSCQPYVLQEMGDNKAFHGRGLLARFLFAIPKSRLGFRTLQPREIPQSVIDRWNRVVCRMLEFEQQCDEYGNQKSQVICLSRAAYAIWKTEQHANEIELRPGGAWAANTGWASKYPGAVLRIAGVLHVAVCADAGKNPAEVDVAESTMKSAIIIGQKIKGHCLKVFGMMMLTEDQKFAQKIVEWIRSESITEFTGRECSIHCNSAGAVKDLDGAFTMLAERGWIRLGQKRQPKGGGRPSQPYEVNPVVAKLNDTTDETRPTCAEKAELSVLSSETANSAFQAMIPLTADDLDLDFHFPGDPVPF